MIPMNFMKSKAGFTLVELIVVIAILAILAGIAVPAYSGYIKKAESAADMQALSSVNTAAQGLAAAEGVAVEKIQVVDANADDDDEANSITVTVTTSDSKTTTVTHNDVESLTEELDTMFRKEFKGATWQAGDWTLTK